MNISRAIRFLRKQKGWTQQQLADFANTSKSNISNLENGNQGYSEAILKYLADALGCRVFVYFSASRILGKTAKQYIKGFRRNAGRTDFFTTS